MMTPQEIQLALKVLRNEIGGKCDVSFSIGTRNARPIAFFCWPVGHGDDAPFFHGTHDDWQEAFDAVRAKWGEISADVRRETVRKMALAIIRITADTGECTNAALRADDFTENEIISYGEEACQQADEMASNGPFRITALQGANAA